MAEISVTPTDETTFRVTVTESGSTTTHDVTVTGEAASRYGAGHPVERLVEASFEFLLQREPKESILTRFELPVIERYFPDYPEQIATLLDNG